jgi:AcrR family transcriptional regulator
VEVESRSRILRVAIGEFAEHGFSGARIERICVAARCNARILYDYFKDKEALYVAALEHVLRQLRADECTLAVHEVEPMEGLLALFEVVDRHYASHPELLQLLSGENLMRARSLRASSRVRVETSSLIAMIAGLLTRGEVSGCIRAGIDPLHLYVLMVALCDGHRSNAYTLSVLFATDVTTKNWQKEHLAYAREMLRVFLQPPAAARDSKSIPCPPLGVSDAAQ